MFPELICGLFSHIYSHSQLLCLKPVATVLLSSQNTLCFASFQKINHFPGMNEICRKDSLARNMNRMLKLFPKDYNIFPRTWCLPAESVFHCGFPPLFNSLNVLTPYLIVLCSYSDFQAYTRAKKNKTYICKPDTGCQGKGIFITKSSKDILPGEHMICQVYISRVRVLLSQSRTHINTETHTVHTRFSYPLPSLSCWTDTSLICVSTCW